MKERLDVILVNMGLAPSREKAKALIMAGEVFIDGEREDKAGASFDPEGRNIEVRSRQLKYVSRGGAVRSYRTCVHGYRFIYRRIY